MRCQWPKVTLTPLQSRLLASLATLALVAVVYWSLSRPQFAYAAELPHDAQEDHNWHRIQQELELEDEVEDDVLGKRATQEAQIRGNNIATPYDLSSGNTTVLVFPNRFLIANHTDPGKGLPQDPDMAPALKVKHIELRKRQDSDNDRTIYISANTCSQPTWTGSDTQTAPPPQLTLYVSTSSGNRQLGPDAGNETQTAYPFVNGFVNASVTEATGDWYMAVSAPDLPDDFSGQWNYQIAVSIDDYFYAADSVEPFLYQVDTDIDSALLVTDNLTQTNNSDVLQQWLDLDVPYTVFAFNENLTGLMGMESSFCGLKNFKEANNQIQGSQNDTAGNGTSVRMDMITRGLGRKPKQQFYLDKLNASSNYQAFLAMDGNSTSSGDGVVGGGGKVWAPVPFRTKSDGNCQLLFNLSFCDEVAYAAPANPFNPAVQSLEALQGFYENYTTTWYALFKYTLAQIPCNTTSDAQYSLAKTCTDCAAAYKEWLCAVSIPRCEDFSNPAPYLQERNMGQKFYNNDSMLDDRTLLANYQPMSKAPTIDGSNAFIQTYNSSFATNRSRNNQIDEIIKPGPYKEVLPCEDLCFSLMQSCPASMQFVCPYPGRGLERSYGKRTSNGNLECSYLGAVYYLSGAKGIELPIVRAVVLAAFAGAVLVLI